MGYLKYDRFYTLNLDERGEGIEVLLIRLFRTRPASQPAPTLMLDALRMKPATGIVHSAETGMTNFQ